MCGGGGGGGSPQPAPPQIQPRNPDLVRVSQRPEKKELLDEDEVRTGVELSLIHISEPTRPY